MFSLFYVDVNDIVVILSEWISSNKEEEYIGAITDVPGYGKRITPSVVVRLASCDTLYIRLKRDVMSSFEYKIGTMLSKLLSLQELNECEVVKIMISSCI